MEEVYVCWEQEYDLMWIDGVMTKDKFDDFIRDFEEKKVKSSEKIKSSSMEIREREVLWKIEYTDEDIQKAYKWLTLDEIKEKNLNIEYIGFNYDILKINDYKIG